MALVTKTYTFTNGATIVAAEHNSNFDTIYNDYNGNITNVNVASNAAIADTKFAQIATASKVSGAALTSLGSVPSGGGQLPSINGGCPTGSLVLWTTDTAPDGWLLCYGQAVSRTTYSTLFGVVSTVFGVGDSSTTFNVPDMRGRFPLGQDDMGGSSANRVTSSSADTVGSSGGSETIDTTQLPSHTHTGTTRTSRGTNSGTEDYWTANPAGSSGSQNTGSTGSGSAYNQPFLTLNYVIKY